MSCIRSSLLSAALAACCLPTRAGDEPPLGLSGSVGAGVATAPTYEGSPHRRVLLAPQLSLSYRTQDWGTVELGDRGAVWRAYDDGQGLSLGVVGTIDPGRRMRKGSALDPTPGDARLAGMGDVKASAGLGGVVGWGPLSLMVAKSLGRSGSRGTLATLGAELPYALSPELGLKAGLSATVADARFLQSYFGVTAAQSAASGYAVFTPKAGLYKLELSVGAEYKFDKAWSLQAGLNLTALNGDAKRSPLVVKKTFASAVVGVSYAF